MKAVFLDKASLDKGDLDLAGLLQSGAEWDIYDHTSIDHTSIDHTTAERTKHAEIIVTNKVVIDKTVINNAAQLKLICVTATGTNNIDVTYANEKGIQVTNVRAYGTHSVAQHVFTLLLMLVRSIPQYQAAIKRGDWQKSNEFCLLDYPIEDLNGKTLGIVGFGELGKGVAKLAEAFGMKVLIAGREHNSTANEIMEYESLPLPELLKQVDVLSLHCPLTPQTENLIDEKELALMKSSALLLNMARGGIVNEEALAKALINKQIAGAAMDVLVKEPPDDQSPLLKLNLPNLIITPHIAWASRTARQNILNQVAENVKNYVAGKEVNNLVV